MTKNIRTSELEFFILKQPLPCAVLNLLQWCCGESVNVLISAGKFYSMDNLSS